MADREPVGGNEEIPLVDRNSNKDSPSSHQEPHVTVVQPEFQTPENNHGPEHSQNLGRNMEKRDIYLVCDNLESDDDWGRLAEKIRNESLAARRITDEFKKKEFKEKIYQTASEWKVKSDDGTTAQKLLDIFKTADLIIDLDKLRNILTKKGLEKILTVKEIWEICVDIDFREQYWKKLAQTMTINESLIEKIDYDVHNQILIEKVYYTITEWEKENGGEVTIKQLIDILKEADLGYIVQMFKQNSEHNFLYIPKKFFKEEFSKTHIEIICNNVGHKNWKRLARFMGLEESEIDKIEERFDIEDLTEKISHIISEWKGDNSGKATIENLAEVLEAAGFKYIVYKIYFDSPMNIDIPAQHSQRIMTNKDIYLVCINVGIQWRELARAFETKESAIIKMNEYFKNKGSIEKIFKIISDWKIDRKSKVTIQELVEKLKTAGLEYIALFLDEPSIPDEYVPARNSQRKLDETDIGIVCNNIIDVESWKKLARFMGFDTIAIDIFDYEFSGLEKKVYETMCKWKEHHDKNTTIQELCKVLEKADFIHIAAKMNPGKEQTKKTNTTDQNSSSRRRNSGQNSTKQKHSDIINDKNSGEDYLGRAVYAEALARNIEVISTPITIGVFARWGGGKSFLLNQVKEKLLSHHKSQKHKEGFSTFRRWIFSAILVILILFAAIRSSFPNLCFRLLAKSSMIDNNNVTSTNETNNSAANGSCIIANNVTSSNTTNCPVTRGENISLHGDLLQYLVLSALLFCFLFACIAVCGNRDWWSSKFFANIPLLMYAAFTKLPANFYKRSNSVDRRYIFVNFNAWKYTGSDMLWAGIVTNLSNAIEDEFGSVTSRLFRMLGVTKDNDDANPYNPENSGTTNFNVPKFENKLKTFLKYPKITCCLPDIVWWLLIPMFAVAIPCVVSKIDLSVDVNSDPEAVALQVLKWLPASCTLFYVFFNCIWAMFHSQRNRVLSALNGTKSALADQLGIMEIIKEEIEYMTNLINYSEIIHNKEYKVVIFIDDLDRIAIKKLKSVLESVNILLSDESSPFVCLIAVDSRIAVKSIEENIGTTLVGSGVSGHEYLKKIINLPFCLPEISNEKKQLLLQGFNDEINNEKFFLENSENNAIQLDLTKMGPYKTEGNELGNGEFVNECRKFLLDNQWIHRYLHENPRNIKRIFNVISLTSWLIQCYHEQDERDAKESGSKKVKSMQVKRSKKLAKDLVIWIILTDQWPSEMIALLRVIEDADKTDSSGKIEQPIPANETLFVIHKECNNSAAKSPTSKNMASMDVNGDLNHFLLELHHRGYDITKLKANILKQITINLDHCIMSNYSKLKNEKETK